MHRPFYIFGTPCAVQAVVGLLILWHSFCPTHSLHDTLPDHINCQSSHQATPDPSRKAPLKPRLPSQYSMLVDTHLVHAKWSYQSEEHFDDINHRAAVTVTFNGTTSHTIFNLDPEEVIMCDIYPDGTCSAKQEAADLHAFIFVGTDGNSKPLPARAFSHNIFDLAEGDLVHVGKTSVRGIYVEHWTSCMEWEGWSAWIQIDYYFSLPDYLDAWGQGQRPVRVVMKGASGQFSTDVMPTDYEFEHIYDYTSFRAGPVRDPSVFQIPTNVVCQGLPDTKDMPRLPDQFQMDIQTSTPSLGSSLSVRQSLRYDLNNRLVETVREFLEPSGIPLRRFKDTKTGSHQADLIGKRRVSWLEDFQTGLQYITDKKKKTCQVKPLPVTVMSRGNALLRLSKEQNYGGQKLFTYQGKSSFQDLPSESWGMEADGIIQKVFYLDTTTLRERLLAKEGLSVEDFRKLEDGMNRIGLDPFPQSPILLGITVRKSLTTNPSNMPSLVKQLTSSKVFKWSDGQLRPYNNGEEGGEENNSALTKYISWGRLQEIQNQHMGGFDIRVYNFQPLFTDQDMFQVSPCYPLDQVTRISMSVRTSYATNVQPDPTPFSISIRASIAKAMGVSILQISDLTLSPSTDKDKTIATFNLLGSHPISSSKNEDLNLKDAKQRLQDAVDRGIAFSVEYSTGTRSFMVSKGALDGDSSLDDSDVTVRNPKELSDCDGAAGVTEKARDLTGGVVAGIVIAAMVVASFLTVVVMMVLFKRRKRPDIAMIPYTSVTKEDDKAF